MIPRPSPITGGSAPRPRPWARTTGGGGSPVASQARYSSAPVAPAWQAPTSASRPRRTALGQSRRTGWGRRTRQDGAAEVRLVAGVKGPRGENDQLPVANQTVAGDGAESHGSSPRRGKGHALARRGWHAEPPDALVVDPQQLPLADPGLDALRQRLQRRLGERPCGPQAGQLIGGLVPPCLPQGRRTVDELGRWAQAPEKLTEHRIEAVGADPAGRRQTGDRRQRGQEIGWVPRQGIQVLAVDFRRHALVPHRQQVDPTRLADYHPGGCERGAAGPPQLASP